jgi:hypothetical protein
MPFLGLNPQAIRLTPSPGASSSPAATTNGTSILNVMVDTATAQNLPGQVAWFKDAQGQISCLAYSIAQASITYAAALMHQAGGAATATGVASTRVRSGYDCNVVANATTAVAGYTGNFAGIAAASVINTGAYFWRFISGFVPEALMGSAIASGSLLTVSGSVAGALGSMNNLNAATVSGTTTMTVGFALGLTAGAGSLASVYLTGWYM